jgi:hypothetical protein
MIPGVEIHGELVITLLTIITDIVTTLLSGRITIGTLTIIGETTSIAIMEDIIMVTTTDTLTDTIMDTMMDSSMAQE